MIIELDPNCLKGAFPPPCAIKREMPIILPPVYGWGTTVRSLAREKKLFALLLKSECSSPCLGYHDCIAASILHQPPLFTSLQCRCIQEWLKGMLFAPKLIRKHYCGDSCLMHTGFAGDFKQKNTSVNIPSKFPILCSFATCEHWGFPCCLLTRRQKRGPFISSFLLQFFCPILRAKPS